MKLSFGPLHVRSVLSDGQGHSYDLSPLAMDSRNWEAESSTDSTKKFYINVCRPLVQMGGQCEFLVLTSISEQKVKSSDLPLRQVRGSVRPAQHPV